MPQIGNTWSIDIHVFVSQGIEPWLTNADAGTRRPQVRTRHPRWACVRDIDKLQLLYFLLGKSVRKVFERTVFRVDTIEALVGVGWWERAELSDVGARFDIVQRSL